MLVEDLLKRLPQFDGIRDVIVPGEQSIGDIETEVINAHKEFRGDYDQVVGFFEVADPLVYLFNFCRKNLPYVIEDEHYQTTRSPAGILSLAPTIGVDCKHYAGWIGGVLDALNRAGLGSFDWYYRFASYKLLNPDPEHVFIVVIDHDGSEIWLDPAPIESAAGFLQRSFNDRKIVPIYYTDKKLPMSLVRLRGISTEPYASINTVYCCGMGLSRDYFTAYDDGGGGGYSYEPVSSYIDPVAIEQPIDTLPAGTSNYLPYTEAPLPEYNVWYVEPSAPVETAPVDQYHEPPLDWFRDQVVPQPYQTTEPAPVIPIDQEVRYDQVQTTAANSTGLQINFSVMDFIKANPLETGLIVVAVGSLIYLATRKKKKKRA